MLSVQLAVRGYLLQQAKTLPHCLYLMPYGGQ